MGTWGTAIFSDDEAADVRNSFKELIGEGLTPEEATQALLKENAESINDPNSGPSFWLGLAATQWSLGPLLPEVRDRALQIIDSGEDLRRWSDDPSLLAKHQKVLAVLREKLLSPPPPAKKVPRMFRDANDWRVGAVVAYRRLDGGLCLLRVIGHHEDKGGKSPIVEVLDWAGRELPSRWEMRWLKVKLGVQGRKQFLIGALSQRDIPTDRVTQTGAVLRPSQKPEGYTAMFWRRLDEDLTRNFGSEFGQALEERA